MLITKKLQAILFGGKMLFLFNIFAFLSFSNVVFRVFRQKKKYPYLPKASFAEAEILPKNYSFRLLVMCEFSPFGLAYNKSYGYKRVGSDLCNTLQLHQRRQKRIYKYLLTMQAIQLMVAWQAMELDQALFCCFFVQGNKNI